MEKHAIIERSGFRVPLIGIPPSSGERDARHAKGRLTEPTLQADRLPPHSEAAERGLLGCALLSPLETLALARRRLTDPDGQEFYDLKHRLIWQTLGRMADEDNLRAVNDDPALVVIHVQRRLKDFGNLDQAGGLGYLADLQSASSGAAQADYWLEIIAEKWVLRQTLQFLTRTAGTLQSFEGQLDPMLDQLQRDFDTIAKQRHAQSAHAERIKSAGAWGEDVWNEFMGVHCDEERGWALPIEFKFRVRLQECTLVTGDDGSGKSTFLNYAALHLAHAGAKVCIASFEMPPKQTLRQLIHQLTGTDKFPDSSAGHALFRQALSWVNKRFYLYDFLGIADWRDVLAAFRHAVEHMGVTVFILDSVMRIGIPDDDYGTQGLAAAQFAQFAMGAGAHLFLVIHENKGGDGKGKVRGSKLWTANVHNIVRIERNMKKGEKLSELWAERVAAEAIGDREVVAEIHKDYEKLKRDWDARAVLQKQREMGTQQNAAKRFYYDKDCFQYREHFEDVATNWLERWRRNESVAVAPAAGSRSEDGGEA